MPTFGYEEKGKQNDIEGILKGREIKLHTHDWWSDSFIHPFI